MLSRDRVHSEQHLQRARSPEFSFLLLFLSFLSVGILAYFYFIRRGVDFRWKQTGMGTMDGVDEERKGSVGEGAVYEFDERYPPDQAFNPPVPPISYRPLLIKKISAFFSSFSWFPDDTWRTQHVVLTEGGDLSSPLLTAGPTDISDFCHAAGCTKQRMKGWNGGQKK